MSDRYLKQVIVVRKDLSMPTGKLAAMVAHAAMTFIVQRLEGTPNDPRVRDRGWRSEHMSGAFTPDEARWLTELDPGLEEIGQVSFAKIVCAADSLGQLMSVQYNARIHGLEVHSVYDSGHSHNKLGDFAAIAIGPAWPEQLEPVTGHLKVYR